MEPVISPQGSHSDEECGNKATTLLRLSDAGFNVPPFFVITEAALDNLPRKELEDRIATACACLGTVGDSFAVRSSSPDEDGHDRSFAGQFDSFLNVGGDDIYDHAVRVLRSGESDNVRAYRKSTDAGASARRPAVMVQVMIGADKAGVAFAADPVSGDTSCAVVAATTGTGDALVSGEVQGDTWRVDDIGIIAEESTGEGAPVLDGAEILRVRDLVQSVSRFEGRPQDIEWALIGDDLFLLQSRDITAIAPAAGEGEFALWDNSNIVESYGGVTLPLTFTVARQAYQEAYRTLGRTLGIREKVIADNARTYEQMIGLVRGRVYYNLLNWYRLLNLTPGFRHNRVFMEQMMGVTEGLPDEALPRPPSQGTGTRIRALLDYSRVGTRLFAKLVRHRRRVKRFHREIDRLLAPVELQDMSLEELVAYYEALQSEVIPAWDTPLLNDLYCMIFHGVLRRLTEGWFDGEHADIHNELVAGEAAIISMEPVHRMSRMAALAAGVPQLVNILRHADKDAAVAALSRYPELEAEYRDYLRKFGDRCLDELKLESRTLSDDPTPLIRSVGHLAGRAGSRPDSGDSRRMADEIVEECFEGKPVKRAIYHSILAQARTRVRDRENMRFERTRVYGRVRAIFVEVGRRLTRIGAIEREDDVFYLGADEIIAFVRGTGVSGRLSMLADARKWEFGEYAASDDPPRRFVTRGPAQCHDAIHEIPEAEDVTGDVRHGQACSRGIVRGPVRVVRDPRDTDFREGEILVAERTDPGWVTVFPLAAAMIMERGSLLSHSAIVARELAIPAVVGVTDACKWLEDGDWVELNGATGTIRKVERSDRAA